jgi:GDP-mannose 6-dehydrogenase
MASVAVFGLGYVGSVTAACLAQDGHSVIGVDVNSTKVGEVNKGIPPISEPGLDELLKIQVKAGRLRATTSVPEAVEQTHVAMIAVGTPSNDDGGVNASVVEQSVRSIGEAIRSAAKPYHIVIRSTLLPGVLESSLSAALEKAVGRPIGSDLSISNNPEFLREGSAVKDYYNPPYVLVGANNLEDGATILALYTNIQSQKHVTDPRTAALVKYASNAFHALKVTFANEIGALAKTLGADGHRVMDFVCQDRKLNISPAYLRPGFAFGGSCLPKDLRALIRYAEQRALRLNLLASILPSNESQQKRALKMIRDFGCGRIGVVGLSFKAGTDDLRESPMVELVETLLGWGYDVKIYDPNLLLTRLRGRNQAYIDQHLPHLANLLIPTPANLLSHSDLLIIGTDVANDYDWVGQCRGQCLDLRKDLA